MADSQTATATRSAVGDMAMAYLAVIIDTCAAAVTLYHADTLRLTGMDIAEIYLSAAVQIHTAAAQRSVTFLYRTVAQLRVAYHIYTAAERHMLAQSGTTRGGVTARNDTAVQRGRMIQRLAVSRQTVIRRSISAVRSEPYYVVRTGGESHIISSANTVKLVGHFAGRVVSGQDGLVGKIPLSGYLVARSSTDTVDIRFVFAAFLAVRHDTVARLGFRRRFAETAIDMDSVVDLEGCIEHRSAVCLRGFRRNIRTGSDIYRSGCQVVDFQIVAQIVDGVLDVVLRRRPTAAVIVIRTARTDITDRIRLRIHA